MTKDEKQRMDAGIGEKAECCPAPSAGATAAVVIVVLVAVGAVAVIVVYFLFVKENDERRQRRGIPRQTSSSFQLSEGDHVGLDCLGGLNMLYRTC